MLGGVNTDHDLTGKGKLKALYLELSWTLPLASLLLTDFNLYPFIAINYKGEYNRSQWVYKYFSWIIKPKCGLGDPHTCNSFQKWGWFCESFFNFTPSKRVVKGSCWVLGAFGNWALQKVCVDEAICRAGVQHWKSSLHCVAEAGIWGSCSYCRSRVLKKPSMLQKLDIDCRNLTGKHIEPKKQNVYFLPWLSNVLYWQFSMMSASKRKYSNLFLHSR